MVDRVAPFHDPTSSAPVSISVSIDIPMDSNHPDFSQLQRLRDAVVRKAKGPERLEKQFPELVRDAI